jgi:glycosyltransferase involved in cell wall biosynthesis
VLSVVIPVYNSEATLSEVAERIRQVLEPSTEVVFVDDGSVDNSWAIISVLAQQHPHWQAIRLGRNSGQHAALLAGIRAARGEVVVTMDDDLQHLPSEVRKLVDCVEQGADLAYGVAIEEEHGRSRSFMSRSIKKVLRVSMGVPYADSISAFRAFRRDLVGAFEGVNDPFVSIDVLLSWATTNVGCVQVEMNVRSNGRSNYTLRKLAAHSFNMITGYSAAPLRVVAYMGLTLSTFGFAALVFVLLRFAVSGAEVAGFTFLAAMLSLISGVQMLAIAIIGEYLGRIHFRAMQRPAYFVSKVFKDGHE